MNKFKSLVLAVIGLLCCVSVSAHHFVVNGIYYNVTSTNMTVEVTYRGKYSDSYSNEYSGAVNIPESVTYNGKTYSVTRIGPSAFYGCSGLTSVEIPNRVTYIWDDAFAYCSGLTSVEIPNSVTSIGDYAFRDCSSLTSVVIPNSVTSIGDYAFRNCNNLKVVLNNSSFTFVKGSSDYGFIAYYAEVVCNGYEQVDDFIFTEEGGACYLRAYIGDKTVLVLPANYKGGNYSIGAYAFSGCSGFTSVKIPNCVTSIGVNAFQYCSGLTSVNIEDVAAWCNIGFGNYSANPLYYADSLYLNGKKVTELVIPNSVTSIGSYAFYGCSGLTSVEIPNSVTSIGSSAFYDCDGLTSVVIPNSVTSIGVSAFYGCNNLKVVLNNSSFTFAKGSSDYGSIAYYAEVVCNGYEQVDDFIFAEANDACYIGLYTGNATDLVLPANYKGGNYSIGSYAFHDCSGLTSVVIPNSVTSIGSSAFYNCSGLTSVVIPNSVTSIGSSAFYNCSGLTSVVIPNSVTSIGEYAFYDCSGLNSLTIGTGVLSIGSNQCTPLKTIWLTNTPPSGWSNLKGTINYVANEQYGSSSNVKVYPYLSSMFETEGVKYVPVSPSERTCDAIDCSYDSAVEAINIGETVSYRGVAMTVKNVMPYAAYGLKTVKKLSVSHKGDVGAYAFYGCTAITNATISNDGNVGASAFAYAMKSENATINITNKGNIGDKAFYCCRVITNATISNGGNIGASAFAGAMTSANATINITNKGNIGDKAFYGCIAITNATISNEGNIGTSAFEGAMTFANATINITNKGNIGDKAFYGCRVITNATISNEGNIGTSAFEGAMTSANATIKITNKGNIGDKAFYGCTAITNATISNEGNIGTSAFEGALKSANATIHIASKGYIDSKAFYGCSGIKTAVIDLRNPNDTKEYLTFEDWTSHNTSNYSTSSKTYNFTLQQSNTLSFDWRVSSEAGGDKLIVVLDGSTVLTKSGENSGTFSQPVSAGTHTLVVKYTKDGSYNSGQDKASVYNINIGVCDISPEAFRGCTSLTSLTLGDSIQTIGASAFRECSSLTEVKIPNLVTQLEPYSFAGTTALKHVELCDSLQGIETYCFSGSGLESIFIPASVTSIGDYAFDDCTKLADVVIEDRTADLSLGSNGSSPLFADCPLDSVYIGGNITYNTSSDYGYSPFYRNTSLRSVVITDQEEEISDNEFYGCTNLKNVTIGGDVKKIGNWAFSGCSNLDYFSFGKSVESIGQEAFSDCVNLTKLISYAEVPPTCGTMALDDINKWNCVLQVPGDCISAYQQADQWKEFFFIEDVLSGIGDVIMDAAVSATADVYSTNGMLIKRNAELKNLKHELPAGIYIIGGKKVWVK